jgi:hypothetical protein
MWLIEEECPIADFQYLTLEQVFHYVMCFKEGIENLVLECKDQFKGCDDRV